MSADLWESCPESGFAVFYFPWHAFCIAGIFPDVTIPMYYHFTRSAALRERLPVNVETYRKFPCNWLGLCTLTLLWKMNYIIFLWYRVSLMTVPWTWDETCCSKAIIVKKKLVLFRGYYSQTSKGKGHPRTGREGPDGEKGYSSTRSLTSALEGGGW